MKSNEPFIKRKDVPHPSSCFRFLSSSRLLAPLCAFSILASLPAQAQLRCDQVFLTSPKFIAAEEASNFTTGRGPSTLEGARPATFVNEKGELIISPHAEFYSNQIVNTKKFRAPRIVSRDQNRMVIQNFFHENKFYEVEVDLSSINYVYVQALPFPVLPGVMAGHIQARFTFYEDNLPRLKRVLDEEQQWIDYIPESTHSISGTIKDLVVSYEAALPQGASYNFLVGAVDANPLVGRILSGEQKHAEGPERQVIQYRLPLTPEEKMSLLERYFVDASQIQMDLYYNTIIRNCTTQIFDGIDTLPRIQKMIEQNLIKPFLTNIGGDPVIGPALKALVDRFGSHLVKVQDLNDERAGKFSEEAVSPPTLEIGRRFAFAPGGENPMSLLVVLDNYDHLSAEQKATLVKIRDEITASLPETFNLLLAASFSMGQNIESGSGILKGMMKIISQKFRQRITQHQFELPEKPVEIKIIFVPYPAKQTTTPLLDRGLRAELPFPVTKLDLQERRRLDFFHTLTKGLDEVESHADRKLPLFLKATGMSLILSRSRSVIHSQFLFGLQPLETAQKIENEQINIDKFTLPSAPTNSRWQNFLSRLQGPPVPRPRSQRVTLLVEHEQSVFSDQIEDTLRAQFGHNPLAASRQQGLSAFVLRPETQNNYFCFAGKYPHGPRLSGRLSEMPLGQGRFTDRILNRILRRRPVTLTITHLDLNLAKLEIESVRLRIGTLGLRCIEMPSVNEQFKNEANVMLKDLIQRLGQNPLPLTDLLQ